MIILHCNFKNYYTIAIALKLRDSLSNTFFNFFLLKFNSLKHKLFEYLIYIRKSLDTAKYFSYILQVTINREYKRERNKDTEIKMRGKEITCLYFIPRKNRNIISWIKRFLFFNYVSSPIQIIGFTCTNINTSHAIQFFLPARNFHEKSYLFNFRIHFQEFPIRMKKIKSLFDECFVKSNSHKKKRYTFHDQIPNPIKIRSFSSSIPPLP